MNLTLRQFLVFKTIVKIGGFRKAAEVLHTSQPALTKTVQPKFSSWSLIPANPGRCFYAISARYRPIVQLKRITKWVSHFRTFHAQLSAQHQQPTQVQLRPDC